MESNDTHCKNCNSPIVGEYCAHCGQRATIHKVTFRETFKDLANSLFSANGPLWKTFKLLIINPGTLFREYLAGKRKRFYKPVAFFVLVSVLYLLIRSLIDYDPFQNNALTVKDETQRQLLTEARNFMLLNIDKFLFVFVFSLGLMMKLFFFRLYSLAEYLTVSFYLVGVYMLFTTINMFYIQFINPKFQFLAMLAMLCYFCYAMISYIQKRKLWVIFKSIIVFFVGLMIYGFTAFGISILLVWLKHS